MEVADPTEGESRRPRDAAATKQRILDAATIEFATKGLAGARVDEIALRAQINKRMIYVYYGSKDDLFLAVLEEAYAGIRTAERQLRLEHLDPLDAIEALVRFTWTYYLEHPEFLRLINTENLHKAVHLKRSKRIQEMHSPFVKMVADVLDRGVAKGVFRDGVEPHQLYISIAALAYYYQNNRYTLSVIYGIDLGAPEALDRRLAFITDMVLHAILKDHAAT